MSFLKDLNPNIRNNPNGGQTEEGANGGKPAAAPQPASEPAKPAQTHAFQSSERVNGNLNAKQPQPAANQAGRGEAQAGQAPASMGPAVSPEDLKAAYDVKNPDQREYQSLAEARDGIAQELGEEKAAPFGEYQRRIKGFIEEHDNARAGIKAKGKQVQLNFRISENSRHYLKLVALENHVDVTTYVFGAINARLHAEGRTRYVR